jgi:plastocyanin
VVTGIKVAACSAWLVAAVALAACGSTSSAPKTATRASGTPSPAQSAAAAITIVAKNLLFDRAELTAPAGAIDVTLINEDAGDVHNVHLFRGDSADGTSVGMTYVANGPSTETVTLNLAAGSYFFHCDVHPALMHGTLTVP